MGLTNLPELTELLVSLENPDGSLSVDNLVVRGGCFVSEPLAGREGVYERHRDHVCGC